VNMNMDSMKKTVDSIEMPEQMQQRIIRACRQEQSLRAPIGRRFVMAVVAAVLCVTLAVPALAANVPEVYRALYAVAPAVAQYLKPVQMSCEDNGIRMEVIAAAVQGDTAEIYIAMQDLMDQRLDDSVDLFDSYDLRVPFDCSATCRQVSFDAETQTATFLITITQWGGQEIIGDKLTFSVSRMLTGKQEFEGKIEGIDLTKVGEMPTGEPVGERTRGWGGADKETTEAMFRNFAALEGGEPLCSPADGVTITAIGYAEGKLRTQILFEDIRRTDNHGGVWFVNETTGETFESIGNISYFAENLADSYDEALYEISPDQLKNCALCGKFITCDTLIEGRWELTFPIQ